MSAWLADSCVNFNLALCRQEGDGHRRRLLLLVHLPPNKVSRRQITSWPEEKAIIPRTKM